MPKLRILYQDEFHVAVDKPAGMHVHPPEDKNHRISDRQNAMKILRDQLGVYVYPVHRLDRGTSGVVLFGLDPETAGNLGRQFQEGRVTKTYVALVRGHLKTESLTIESPLTNDVGTSQFTGEEKPAKTEVKLIQKYTLLAPIGRYSETRLSLVFSEPKTGRTHQIRRHLRRENHPLIGDSLYGDSHYNRFFRENLGKQVLFLKALRLEWEHPRTREKLQAVSRWSGDWHQVFDRVGVCPWVSLIPQAD